MGAFVKNGIFKTKGWDLGAEPPRIKFCFVPPVDQSVVFCPESKEGKEKACIRLYHLNLGQESSFSLALE